MVRVGSAPEGRHGDDSNREISKNRAKRLVEKAEAVSNGQMVVALVDEENVTLKKYYREDGIIRLQPANPELQPIYVTEDRLRVQGVVIGVMRRY